MYTVLYKLFPFGIERVQVEKLTILNEAIRETKYLLTLGACQVRVTNAKNETVFEEKK